MVRCLQMPSEGLVDLPVYIKGVGLSGLGFSDLDGLSRFGIFDVGDFEFKQIASSDSVVDAKREKQQITGPPGKQLFDGLNMGQFSDWLKVCAQGQIAQPPRSACDDRWGCAMAYGLCINKYFYCHALSHDVRLSKVFSLLKPVVISVF